LYKAPPDRWQTNRRCITGDEALNGTGSLEQILGEITMLELEERFVFSEISIWLRAASLH